MIMWRYIRTGVRTLSSSAPLHSSPLLSNTSCSPDNCPQTAVKHISSLYLALFLLSFLLRPLAKFIQSLQSLFTDSDKQINLRSSCSEQMMGETELGWERNVCAADICLWWRRAAGGLVPSRVVSNRLTLFLLWKTKDVSCFTLSTSKDEIKWQKKNDKSSLYDLCDIL